MRRLLPGAPQELRRAPGDRLFGRALVLPAFCDLHLHAPQMVNRGVGYDQSRCPAGDLHLPGGGLLRRRGLCRGGVEAFLNRMWANGTPALFPPCHHPQGARPLGG